MKQTHYIEYVVLKAKIATHIAHIKLIIAHPNNDRVAKRRAVNQAIINCYSDIGLLD